MKTKWYNDLYQFWLDNLQRNVKKISIGFGSLLIVLISTCSLPTPIFFASLYGAGISFGTMTIMSIFGKNGNGQPKELDDELVNTSKPLYPESELRNLELNEIENKPKTTIP